MTDTPQVPSAAASPIRPLSIGRGASPAGAPSTGPAFEALLDRLTARAAELEQKSKTLETPDQLPQAVDAAKASLEDALDLGEKLLEAYRAAQRAPGETR